MKTAVLLPCLTLAAALATSAQFAESPAVDDAQLLASLARGAEELQARGQTTPLTNLLAQLQRRTCSLKLAPVSAVPPAVPDLAARWRESVVVVGGVYKCTKCPRWHTSPATGFVISDSGAIATCHHVVNKPTNSTLVVMTSGGKVHPVKEILAADAASDLAILKIDATGLKALPIAPAATVGEPIRVLSHPDRHFFMLTEGIVSRHLVQRKAQRPVTMMAITADFGRGSSGAPVFNLRGAVVGIVDATQSLYYSETNGVKQNLQMVFKHCVASKHLLELVKP